MSPFWEIKLAAVGIDGQNRKFGFISDITTVILTLAYAY